MFNLLNTKVGRDSIIAHNPDYIILSGDVANTSINNDYRKHVTDGLNLFRNIVHYSVKGNHDARTWTTYAHWFHNADLTSAFSEDFYSFVWLGPVHYIAINNNMRQQDYPAGALTWLQTELATHRATWKIVFMKANPAITWSEYASWNA